MEIKIEQKVSREIGKLDIEIKKMLYSWWNKMSEDKEELLSRSEVFGDYRRVRVGGLRFIFEIVGSDLLIIGIGKSI